MRGAPASKSPQVALDGTARLIPEPDHPLFVPLPVTDVHAPTLKVDLYQQKVAQLGRPEAGVQ